MDEVLSFKRGRVPLLISMPHPGTRLTPAVDAGLVEEARALTDTDWHIPRLYDFAEELGASTLAAHYSRYVVDLNRPSDDKPLYLSLIHIFVSWHWGRRSAPACSTVPHRPSRWPGRRCCWPTWSPARRCTWLSLIHI